MPKFLNKPNLHVAQFIVVSEQSSFCVVIARDRGANDDLDTQMRPRSREY